MPVDQDAANSYESNATGSKWAGGLDDADSPGQGLQDAGVSNLNTQAFDNEWQDGVSDPDAQSDYEDGIDGSAWLSAMSDASDWNIG